jgi:exodeoxyribonuclease VII small subunit
MKEKDLNFEKALGDLETTVDRLEKGGLSLNDSLALFEKGVRLARFLRDELDKAEKKVELLLKDDKGGLKAQPFRQEGGEDAESTESDPEAEAEEDDEGGDDDESRDGAKDDRDKAADAAPARKSKGKPRSGGSAGGGKKPGGDDDDESLPF